MPDANNLKIHTVLVRPIYPRNIGQAVRATMNMGFGKVFLIAPQCEIGSEARQGAAGAQRELTERTEFASWDEFNAFAPNSYRIALTRRIGKHRKLFPFEVGVESFYKNIPHQPEDEKEIYLIFGPEDDGLCTDDLDHVNICCHLPLYGDFKSLNLAHASLLAQHLAHDVYFKKILKSSKSKSSIKDKPQDFFDQAVTEDFFPDQSLDLWLKSMGFILNPNKLNAFETIKKMILRAFPSKKELSTFEKALRQSIKKMTNEP